MKLRRSTKIALVVAALLASSPSSGQVSLIPRIVYYMVILGGSIILMTPDKAEAKKAKQENPGSEIKEIRCPRGLDPDDPEQCRGVPNWREPAE
jgi:hypothetical protein